ncbi:uncharacterized protein IL334_007118 [Kwoniella shivajii]|uniref:Uncharacterized protein n=1 Tax=Kwoniella shivajii TaxID=564305 RepID=A0ABZ1D9M9_9TREE|nr:hypothetical protein IL334_007118 [Kwoniella shivajii]
MPPDSKRSRDGTKSDTEKSSSGKLSSSRSSSSGSSPSRSSKSLGHDNFLKSHAGYLRSPIISLSITLSLSPLTSSLIFTLIFITLHLFLPLFLVPHVSAFITLFIPIQNTINAILLEKKGKKSDSPQWALYWIIYCLLGWMRGYVGLWAPNTRGIYEIARSGILVVVGGPWFGREGLRPDLRIPSKKLSSGNKKASEREEHRRQKR